MKKVLDTNNTATRVDVNLEKFATLKSLSHLMPIVKTSPFIIGTMVKPVLIPGIRCQQKKSILSFFF